ncbi:hypothetical protein T459_00649 [Capsicum annuum]|uniref:Uncharacterized protein n=1 Tax=Capsicum annuum TaxID=4072 RepID=A0A2G3AEV3_CAPAN|nr:hypothetical protein T459_00649 [Capsicum annuum]
MVDIKYKSDWMKQPISDDEIGWLPKVLVKLSGWLNESLGLSPVESTSQDSPSWSYLDLSSDTRSEYGPMEMINN